MSVLCCYIPDFLLNVHRRSHPFSEEGPLALLGEDGRVMSFSAEARASGISRGMSARQAHMRCPELHTSALNHDRAEAEQAMFLHALGQSDLPIEAVGWGSAYVDLHWLATEKEKVQPLCADLGRAIRRTVGDELNPQLGWDSGKFTARVAAARAKPGHMQLVDKTEETRFLRPQPVSLLPLSPRSMQQLRWLGIRSLGQYARLPEVSVWQRFGQAGKVAWRWAQGRDERPVRSSVAREPEPLVVDFVPAEERSGPVLTALMAKLTPIVTELSDQLCGIRRMRLYLRFQDGSTRSETISLVEATDQESKLHAMLAHRLETVTWPDVLEQATLYILETGERPIGQAMLFPEMDSGGQQVYELVEALRGRYGPIFYRCVVSASTHPAPERRSHLIPVGGRA